jgi:hypothetical protein
MLALAEGRRQGRPLVHYFRGAATWGSPFSIICVTAAGGARSGVDWSDRRCMITTARGRMAIRTHRVRRTMLAPRLPLAAAAKSHGEKAEGARAEAVGERANQKDPQW